MKVKVTLFSILLFLSSFFYNTIVVSATALFLNHAGTQNIPKVYMMTAVLIPSVTFSLQKLFQFLKIYKYVFLLYLFISFGFLFSVSFLHSASGSILYAWFYFAFGVANYKLMRMVSWNFIGRYFNVFDARDFFPLFSAVEEIGVIVSSLLIRMAFSGQSIGTFLNIGYLNLLALGLLVFLVSSQREIKFRIKPAGPEDDGNLRDILKSKMFFALVVVFISYEAMKYGLGYEFNAVLGHHFATTAQIGQAMSLYTMSASAFIILFNLGLSKYLFRYLMLPNLQIFYAALVLMSLLCLNLIPFWFIFIMAEYFRKTFDHILFNPSYQQMTNTFSPRVRLGLKSVLEGLVTPASGLVMSFSLLFFPSLESFRVLNAILFFLSLVWVLSAIRFKGDYLDFHLKNLFSTSKELIIRSVQALGEYKNFMAIEPLLGLLNAQPKKLVRKNIILSLGRIRIEDLIKTLFKEMEQPQEELQVATLDSLSKFDSFLVQRFLIDLIHGNKCRSLHVRLHTLTILYGLIGDTIIPILLPYLDSQDDRIVANTIEAMSVTQNKKIIDILRPYLEHSNNRVRANAVMALYPFRKLRPVCIQTLGEMLKSPNELDRLSFLYAVGRLKLRRFREDLKKIGVQESKQVKQNVAFALSNMEEAQGYELFSDLFLSYDESTIHACLHHFLQLRIGIRFRILEYYVHRQGNIDTLIKMLKSADFDFHEEIEFLHSLQK